MQATMSQRVTQETVERAMLIGKCCNARRYYPADFLDGCRVSGMTGHFSHANMAPLQSVVTYIEQKHETEL